MAGGTFGLLQSIYVSLWFVHAPLHIMLQTSGRRTTSSLDGETRRRRRRMKSLLIHPQMKTFTVSPSVQILLREAPALCQITWAAFAQRQGFQSLCWARTFVCSTILLFSPIAANCYCQDNLWAHVDVCSHVSGLPHRPHVWLAIKG